MENTFFIRVLLQLYEGCSVSVYIDTHFQPIFSGHAFCLVSAKQFFAEDSPVLIKILSVKSIPF